MMLQNAAQPPYTTPSNKEIECETGTCGIEAINNNKSGSGCAGNPPSFCKISNQQNRVYIHNNCSCAMSDARHMCVCVSRAAKCGMSCMRCTLEPVRA